MCRCLQLLIDRQWLKSVLELIHREFLAVPLLQATVDRLRWDENVAHDVDDSVGRDAI